MFKKMNLFSKTELKIFQFILSYDGEKYEREIAKAVKVSVGSANSILRKFEKMGLLSKTTKGRMNFYRRNDENIKIRQYKIVLTMEILEQFVNKMKELSSLIILFGSCAEGRNTEKSDIDLFVVTEDYDKIRKILNAAKTINAIILNKREYANLREKDKPLYERIEKGMELWREIHDD